MRITDKQLVNISIFLLALSLLTGLHIMELRGEEPRRAVISLEMMIRNSFVDATLLGWDYYNKPPVYNWILIVFFTIFSSASEFVVRLPGILAFMATGYGIYRFAKPHLGKEAGMLASFIFLISIDLYFYGAIVAGEIDLFYTLLIFLQLAALFHYYQRKRWFLLFFVSYTFVAIGMLTKGLPSLFHQGVSLIALAIYYKNYRFLFSWQHVVGGLYFLLLFGGYFYWYDQSGSAENYLVTLFFESQSKSGAESGVSDLLIGLIKFPFRVLYLLLPGSLLVIYLLKKGSIKSISKDDLFKFCLLIFTVNILVYWFSPDVKNRYIYILFPFAAIMLAYIWKNLSKISFRTILIIVIAASIIRLAYNFIGIPMQQSHFVYRTHIENILEISGDEQIYFYDDRIDMSFDYPFGLSDELVSYQLPAVVSYRVAYYITRGNNDIFQYTESPVSGAYHIALRSKIPKDGAELLYEIDRGDGDDLWLFKYP